MFGEIIKTFDGSPENKLDYGTITTSYVSWERLKPYIEKAIALKSEEEIKGIVCDKDGIKVVLK